MVPEASWFKSENEKQANYKSRTLRFGELYRTALPFPQDLLTATYSIQNHSSSLIRASRRFSDWPALPSLSPLLPDVTTANGSRRCCQFCPRSCSSLSIHFIYRPSSQWPLDKVFLILLPCFTQLNVHFLPSNPAEMATTHRSSLPWVCMC